MIRLTLAALLLLNSFGCKTTDEANSDVLFYGADNSSATMNFKSFVWVPLPAGMEPKEVVEGQNLAIVDGIIDLQVQHMFGAFTEHPEYVNNPGIALNAGSKMFRGKPTVSILKDQVSRVQNNKFVRVPYTYRDEVVFHKDLIGEGPKTIEFRLPRDPPNIYKSSLMPINKAIRTYQQLIAKETDPNRRIELGWGLDDLKHNKEQGEKKASLCTDLHYNSEGDFWYFWNPDKAGCSLKKSDVVTVKANLEPIESTKRTFPYYDKMYGDNGNGNKFEITYLVGIDENFRKGDLGRKTFNEAIGLLKKAGFKVVKSENTNRHRTFVKSQNGVEFSVNMHLTDPNTKDFVKRAKHGLEKSDVFIYDGHSGLGGYLFFDRFQEELGTPLNLDKNKKQIYYFNGCSTFSYYNAAYFAAKGGNESLDVVTTSIGALFSIGARHDVKVIEHLTSGQRPTWQKIMDDVFNMSPEETALTHVNGDEDNPTQP